MNKYNTFLTLFIITVVTFFIFITFYFNGILSFVFQAHENTEPSAWDVLSLILNPPFLISLIIFGMASLACRILGIVYVAQNKTISDGEKAIWILGFIFMGFITSIVFLVMAKGKNFV